MPVDSDYAVFCPAVIRHHVGGFKGNVSDVVALAKQSSLKTVSFCRHRKNS